jgi:Tol biopolymer transport system component
MAAAQCSIVLIVCITATLFAAVRSNAVVTVAQTDRYRSPRAPRTVDISGDGRMVAFQSLARLVPADTNDNPDIYVFDRTTGRVTLESVISDADDHSHPRISADGRYLVFESIHAGRTGADIVFRDRVAGTVRELTGLFRGADTQTWSRNPVISGDGRVVAFSSAATNLVEGQDANGMSEDVYLVTLPTGTIARASLSSAGVQMARGNSILPSLSGDGRWVAFSSTAPLMDKDAVSPSHRDRPYRQVYLRDVRDGLTRRVTRAANGGAPNGDSSLPSISGDGRYLAFVSEASNMLDDDQNQSADVLLYDRETDALSWVSRSADGSSANGESTNPVISSDGRFVTFQSDASNLVCSKRCSEHTDDINLLWDVFLFDRTTGQFVRVSEDDLGGWMESSAGPAVDGSGTVVAFSSRHPVDAADRGDDFDLFVRAMTPPTVVTRKFR